MPKTSMLLPRDLIIPALHHATAINNVRSQNLRHTARIYAISIAKRVTENGMNSNTLHLKITEISYLLYKYIRWCYSILSLIATKVIAKNIEQLQTKI